MAKDTLQQREARYRKVRQPGVLERLPNGLMIVRRYKHEWDERLNGLTHRELAKETDHARGSKFLPKWTLSRYVSWLEKKVAELKWDSKTLAEIATFEEAEGVGYSNAVLVNTIKIVIDSGFVHAYPVGE